MNRRTFQNNTFEDSSDKLKPVIKTVFINTDSSSSLLNTVVGIAMLFFCILAGTVGAVSCFADSFALETGLVQILLQSFILLVIFTAIYLLPSKLLTGATFLAGAALFGLYIYTNVEKIFQALYYTFNLCLYKIATEGYIIGNIVDYGLAQNPNPDAAEFINTSVFLLSLVIVCIFSYIVYSKKSMWVALLISLVVIFPGFFYGFIPSYFSFGIIAAFWVSVFAVNIFETGYIESFINRSNKIPEKRFEKYQYKMFKEQYKENVKKLKAEISEIVKSPNREENSLRLNRLVRELQKISNSQDWFLRFYGLNKLYAPRIIETNDVTNVAKNNKNDKTQKNNKNKKSKEKEKFQSPLKLEKLRIKEEKRAARAKQIAEYEAHKKELHSMPAGKRFKLYLKESFLMKVERSTKSGYVGFFAFVMALVAVIAAQPFVSPQAKLKTSLPQEVLETLTSTVEYLLVGSNSRVYGGYSGGMGGGFLLNPNGANFEYKPILKVKPTTNRNLGDGAYFTFPQDTFQSGVVYLKNWHGSMYNGQRWFEADKTHVAEYDSLKENFVAEMVVDNRRRSFDEGYYFEAFTRYMQERIAASTERRNAELRRDSMVIEHLVSGGRASFLPYFNYNIIPSENYFAMEKTADLNVSLARPLNSLFRYPEYAAMFFSVDNVLNRSEVAVEDLKQYLVYYENVYPMELEIASNEYRDVVERRNELRPRLKEIFYTYGVKDSDVTWYRDGRFSIANDDIEWDINGNITIHNDSRNDFNSSDFVRAVSEVAYVDNLFVALTTPNSQLIREMESFYNAETAYHDFVMENYLDIADDFPEEVADLALDIVQNANAATNFEKALAIEEYLAENHDYTLHPMMPDDPTKDFIYNFLFQTKEGYCTYYATSMVMMLRSLGIPARYVEGYLVDMRRVQRDEENNRFITVYDSNGHAWPEVYIRGIGWIPFEPTTSIIETPTETEPYVYTPPARLPGYDMMGEMTTMAEEELEEDEIFENQAVREMFFLLVIILAAVAIILILNIVNYLIKKSRAKYFKTAKSKDAVVKMFAYTLKFLKHCGFVMHNDEGLNKFAERVSQNLELFIGTGFTRTARIMQKARYSSHEMSEEERSAVYDFVDTLNKNAEKHLKPNLKLKFKYLYFIL